MAPLSIQPIKKVSYMPDLTQLNSDNHPDLRIAKDYTGMDIFNENTFPVLLTELPALQREYPIVILKSGRTGLLSLHVLTGLNEGENQYILKGKWEAQHIPLFVSRHPFSLRLSQTSTATILVDISHPAFHQEPGIPLFTQDGLPAPFTVTIQQQLANAYRSQAETNGFLDFINRNDLLTPLSIKYVDALQAPQRRDGMFVPSIEKLHKLDNEVIQEAIVAGYYKAMVLIEASMLSTKQLVANERNKPISDSVDTGNNGS